jgi:hypothetical protein
VGRDDEVKDLSNLLNGTLHIELNSLHGPSARTGPAEFAPYVEVLMLDSFMNTEVSLVLEGTLSVYKTDVYNT